MQFEQSAIIELVCLLLVLHCHNNNVIIVMILTECSVGILLFSHSIHKIMECI